MKHIKLSTKFQQAAIVLYILAFFVSFHDFNYAFGIAIIGTILLLIAIFII